SIVKFYLQDVLYYNSNTVIIILQVILVIGLVKILTLTNKNRFQGIQVYKQPIDLACNIPLSVFGKYLNGIGFIVGNLVPKIKSQFNKKKLANLLSDKNLKKEGKNNSE